MLFAVELARLLVFAAPKLDEGCAGAEKKLMYNYDEALNDCFAIRVSPCDVAAQKQLFNTAQCFYTMRANKKCSGGSKPVPRKDGSIQCDANSAKSKQCAKGSVCTGKVCCDAEIESEHLMEKYVTSCGRGIKAIRADGQILYSKSCSVDFCPHGSTCTMGRNYAFCCPPY